MYSHIINFVKRARNNLPVPIQNTESFDWVTALTKPVRDIYNEWLIFRRETLYKSRFNGQAMYLQAILNLRFDPVFWRIHVVDILPKKKNIIWTKAAASHEVNYIYKDWSAAINYLQGKFAHFKHYNYIALSANIASSPEVAEGGAGSNWQLHTNKGMVLRRKISETFGGYIVYIHSDIAYDAAALNSVMNFYRFQGPKYLIKNYP